MEDSMKLGVCLNWCDNTIKQIKKELEKNNNYACLTLGMALWTTNSDWHIYDENRDQAIGSHGFPLGQREVKYLEYILKSMGYSIKYTVNTGYLVVIVEKERGNNLCY